MIRNLIIGGNGFIGSELNKFLIKNGEQSSVFGKSESEEDIKNCKIPTTNCDFIYFLAWDFGGSKYLNVKENLSRQIENNLKIISNSLPQLIESKKRIVFVSTFAADDIEIPYGVTKRAAEIWLSNFNCNIIRLGNIYGKVKKDNIKSDVISDFICQAINNKEIVMKTNGQEKRQFIHYEDAVRIIKISSEQRSGEIYDTYSNFEWVPIIKVAEIIANLTGAKIIKGKEKGIDRNPVPRKSIKNFTPTMSLESGLIKTIESF